ncbi:hypothetical protein N0V84_008434 [Fusarium piperis]|uniref:DUF7924 domain-containing protein n=1 Tax=Fusarium piperis TaxID=1435070 RepID=A0A9W8W885_9HYPO|nr:hypothetical protein N0V84_008434 [Fusarium piperis]
MDDRMSLQAPAPDVMYGYQEAALRRSGGIPSWVIDDGKATESSLFYPFLTVHMQGHGLASDGCMHRATNECMIASSICVRMLDKLNQRLAVRQRGDTCIVVNSAAFSIAMNGAVARIYVTFAFDEERDHVYKVDSFVLENPSHYRKFHRYIQSIIDWGKNERLWEIRDAIESRRRTIFMPEERMLLQTSDSWRTRGSKQESANDSESYRHMIGYEMSRIDDDETQLPHSDTHQPQLHGNRPGGRASHSVLGRYDDCHALQRHNILYLSFGDVAIQVPPVVRYIYESVMNQARDPGTTPERIRIDARLHDLEFGSSPVIKGYFKQLFTPPPSSRIQGVSDQTMCYGVVPHLESIEGPRPPTPAMLYGYALDVFSNVEKQQQTLFEAEATRSCLYPFFTIDIQGDGPISTGSLWTAFNTCLASSAGCVALFSKLERRVHQVTGPFSPELNNVAFSIAMSGTEARLFVTYRMDEGVYGMYKAESFLLQDPEGHIRFRKCVLNIIEWGQQRLVKIRDALRYLRTNDPNEAMRMNFRYPNYVGDDGV